MRHGLLACVAVGRRRCASRGPRPPLVPPGGIPTPLAPVSVQSYATAHSKRHQRRVGATGAGRGGLRAQRLSRRHCRAEEGQKLSQIADYTAWYCRRVACGIERRRRHCQRSRSATRHLRRPRPFSARRGMARQARALEEKLNPRKARASCASCTRSGAAEADMTLADATKAANDPGSSAEFSYQRVYYHTHRRWPHARRSPLCWRSKIPWRCLSAAASPPDVAPPRSPDELPRVRPGALPSPVAGRSRCRFGARPARVRMGEAISQGNVSGLLLFPPGLGLAGSEADAELLL